MLIRRKRRRTKRRRRALELLLTRLRPLFNEIARYRVNAS
jgi:hypothetical protein